MLKKVSLTIQLRARNAIRHYRQQGLLHLLKLVSEHLGFVHFNNSLIFLKLDMNDIPAANDETPSFNILTVDNVQNEADYDDGFFTKEQSICRLLDGHQLFVFKDGAKMVFFLWAEHKKATVWWYDSMPVCLTQNMSYVSGAYTLPEYRGRGIAYNLKKEIFQYLKKNGIEFLFEVVHPQNTTALNIDERLGFRKYQIVNYKRYWHIRYYTVQKWNSDERKSFVTLFKAPKDIWKKYL